MKPPSKGKRVEREVWQVDSSSWEFLGRATHFFIHSKTKTTTNVSLFSADGF